MSAAEDYTPGAGGAMTGVERPCAECGGTVRPTSGHGRTVSYRGASGFPVPANLLMPTCAKCGTVWENDVLTEQLDAICAPLYAASRPPTGPESALSSLPSCPVYWDADPGRREREPTLPSCDRPSRPSTGRDLVCTAGHRFAGTPAEHEQARGALAVENRGATR